MTSSGSVFYLNLLPKFAPMSACPYAYALTMDDFLIYISNCLLQRHCLPSGPCFRERCFVELCTHGGKISLVLYEVNHTVYFLGFTHSPCCSQQAGSHLILALSIGQPGYACY